MSKQTIAIIGGGNMGSALIKGLHEWNRVLVCEHDAQRVLQLRADYKITVAPLPKAVALATIVILAVKPQDMKNVLVEIRQCLVSTKTNTNKLFISIAAGLTTEFFETHLGNKAKVVRCMPNMPALIREGITALCAGKHAKSTDLSIAQELLGTIGQIMVVKESMMDAVTAVSGSGPAYVFLFVEQWIAAAQTLGFSEEQAKELVYQTLIGSACLLEELPLSAATLRAKVTSKGGTTEAAMEVFAKGKFDQLIQQALLAAKQRARELNM